MPRKRKLPDGMVTRPGRKGYYADFRAGGRRVQKRLSTDFDAACTILNALKARADKADFDLVDNDYPLKDLKEAYLKKCAQELRPRSFERYEECLDRVLGWLGVGKVRQLNAALVLGYREHRLREACAGTVNMEVLILGAMLNWGAERKIIGSNPLDGIDPLPHDDKKEGRPLDDDEVSRLLGHSLPRWRDVWYTFLVTGIREAELRGLLFTDLDWEARELIVRPYRAKGKKERRIPIEDGLWVILKRLAAEAPARQPGTHFRKDTAERTRQSLSRDHVFVTTANTPISTRGQIYRAFMRTCRKAGIQTHTFDAEGRLVEHVDVHSLRRTFATNALVNGADPKSVQEILGHKTLKMTMTIYAKIKAAPKRQAVAKLSYASGVTPPAHVLPLPPAANG